MEYIKNALSVQDQIAMLQQRGLIISDLDAAEKFLNNVSYFRFDAYLHVFEVGEKDHLFHTGATFEQAATLYFFDDELRKILFGAIQKIEIALRSRIIHYFSLAHGPFWFLDPTLWVDQLMFAEDLSTLEHELKRTKEDFVKEHFSKYNTSLFPPAWKMLELASFGCLFHLYRNFNDTPVKKRVARSFGVSKPTAMESWMRAVHALRNMCAHHARIWNRKMTAMPQLPAHFPRNWINTFPDPQTPYAVICCIAYWLNGIDENNTFVSEIKELFGRFPTVSPLAMGFTRNWQQEPLWS